MKKTMKRQKHINSLSDAQHHSKFRTIQSSAKYEDKSVIDLKTVNHCLVDGVGMMVCKDYIIKPRLMYTSTKCRLNLKCNVVSVKKVTVRKNARSLPRVIRLANKARLG